MTIVQLIELAEAFQKIGAFDLLALKEARFDDLDLDTARTMLSWLSAVERLSGNDEDLGDTVGAYVAEAAQSLRRRGGTEGTEI